MSISIHSFAKARILCKFAKEDINMYHAYKEL